MSTEVYSEPCQISQTELFAKTVNDGKSLTIFTKNSILNVKLGSECPSLINITPASLYFPMESEHK